MNVLVMARPQMNKYYNVRALSPKVKCGCSVQRILEYKQSDSKHATK